MLMRRRATLTFQLVLLLSLLLALPAAQAPRARAATPAPELWVTDGDVWATAIAGNTLYLGGAFSQVGPSTGSLVELDAANGTYNSAFPKFSGAVGAMVSDRAGGWYVGGTFSFVNGVPRARLAHIRADKTLDLNWNAGANQEVRALALSGDTLYVGGNFTAVNGQTRLHLAALDATTGALKPWDPRVEGSDWDIQEPEAFFVNALAVNGNTLYIGGYFGRVSGQVRTRLAAFDVATGVLRLWSPHIVGIDMPDNSYVNALAVIAGTIYVGGYFTAIDGQARSRLAAFDAATGALKPLNLDVVQSNGPGYIHTLVASGSTLYVGGAFTSVAGQPRNGLAALDAASGALKSWNPSATTPPFSYVSVYALAVTGATTYVGGVFERASGQQRQYLATVDTVSGVFKAWNPAPGAEVLELAVAGDRVYAGGVFTSVGMVQRANLAALDLTSGRPTAWNPGADRGVKAIEVSESTVYIGGGFTHVAGQVRNYLAAITTTSGAILPWNPNADQPAWTLVVSGTTVYVGGAFEHIGGQPRPRLAAVDAATGALRPWTPRPVPHVQVLAAWGNAIYAAGTTSDPETPSVYRFFGAFDATTGADLWQAQVDGQVLALSTSEGTLYAGGLFGAVNGQVRRNLAAFDGVTGKLRPWNPESALGSIVWSLAANGNIVYVGGDFTRSMSLARDNAIALDTSSGEVLPWRPALNATVWTLCVSGATVYAGGSFSQVGWQPFRGIAAIPITLPTAVVEATTSITSSGAILHGSVTSTTAMSVSFQLSMTPGDYSSSTLIAAAPSMVSSGNASPVQANVTGLRPGMLYFYRLLAISSTWTTISEERAFITTGQRVVLPLARR